MDVFASRAFRLGLMLCLLAVVVVACIAVVACSGPTAPTFEERQAESGSDPQGRPLTTDTGPVYCADDDTWAAADNEMGAPAARYGPDTST